MTDQCSQDFSSASLKSMQKLAKKRLGKCLSTTYDNTRAKLRWQCQYGHIWESSRNMVLKRGSWCPTCVLLERQRKGLAEVQAVAQKQGGACLSTQYTNNHTKLTFRCNMGHVWQASTAQIKSAGRWCPTCRTDKSKHSLAYLHALAARNGGLCLAKKHTSMNDAVLWQCAKGHQWKAPPSRIYTGSWCHQCASDRQRLTIEEMQEVAKARGGRCVSKEYKNAPTKLLWECHLGHQWEASPNNIKNGKWCPSCANLARSTREQTRRKYLPDGPIADKDRL